MLPGPVNDLGLLEAELDPLPYQCVLVITVYDGSAVEGSTVVPGSVVPAIVVPVIVKPVTVVPGIDETTVTSVTTTSSAPVLVVAPTAELHWEAD